MTRRNCVAMVAMAHMQPLITIKSETGNDPCQLPGCTEKTGASPRGTPVWIHICVRNLHLYWREAPAGPAWTWSRRRSEQCRGFVHCGPTDNSVRTQRFERSVEHAGEVRLEHADGDHRYTRASARGLSLEHVPSLQRTRSAVDYQSVI